MRATSVIGLGLLGAFGLTIAVGTATSPASSSSAAAAAPSRPPPSRPQPSADEVAKQPERKRLLQKLVNADVFTKLVHEPPMSRIYVGRQFYEATIDQKRSFVSAAFAYHWVTEPSTDMAIIYDGRSGKKIGTFTRDLGLSLD